VAKIAPYDWPVVENGLDFLETAVEDLATGDERRHKYAAMHLFASIEVLVKARLGREHWSLVISKVESASIQSYQAGNFQSVGAVAGLERLQKIAGVEVSEARIRDVKAVEQLRNRVAHFALAGEAPQAVASQLGRGLDFLLWFLETQLRPGAPAGEAAAIDDILESIGQQLGEIKALVKERMKSIAADLQEAGAVVVCPRCEQAALALFDGVAAKCLFCLWAPTGEVSAGEYVGEILGMSHYVVVKDGGTWPIHPCVNCGVEALVEGIESVGHGPLTWGCFSCGFVGASTEVDHCARCGQVIIAEIDGLSVCADCFSYVVDSD
jgi:hypothetical protein